MKFAVTGAKNTGKIRELVKRHGFQIDVHAPEIVLTYGGDGSILFAEREYPGIPKITVRASSAELKSFHSVQGFESHAFKCMYAECELEGVLEKVKRGKYDIREEMKLSASYCGKEYLALNEVQLHNRSPVKAVRFSVYARGAPLFENVVGDGVVVATPFGSSAYYSSIGGKPFRKGMGIALNNPHMQKGKRNIVVDSASEICIKILRDEGEAHFDNNPEKIGLKEGDEIVIKAAKAKARFVVVK